MMIFRLTTYNLKPSIEEMISIRDRCRRRMSDVGYRISDVQPAGPEATVGHLLWQPMAYSVN